MRVKNTMRLVRVANNYINIYYDIEAEHVIDIMQGLKAARAEQNAAKKIPSVREYQSLER